MKQIQQAKFICEDAKIQLLCDSDTALGDLHDFLMALKGEIVDRMVKAQKDEEKASEEHKEEKKEIIE
jgi:hypothetical protein